MNFKVFSKSKTIRAFKGDKPVALLKKRDCTADLPPVRAVVPEKLPRLFRLMPGMRAKPQAGG